MTGYRVKIVSLDKNRVPKTDAIIQIAATVVEGLYVLDAFPTKDGAVLLLDNTATVECFLQEKTQTLMKTKGLMTLQPDWLIPAKTIFISKVPLYVTDDRTENDIKQEINKENPNLKADKVQIIRNKRHRTGDRLTLKITFTTDAMAARALAKGLCLFSLSLPPERLALEKSNRIKQCFLCFEYNHSSGACNREYCLCSICGNDHHYSNCPRPGRPRCINCGEGHNAVSKFCKIRQRLIEEAHRAKLNRVNSHNNNSPPNRPSPHEFPPMGPPNHQQTFKQSQEPQEPVQPILEFVLRSISKYAELKAKDDADLYLDIINRFLDDNDYTTIPDPLRNSDRAPQHKQKPRDKINSNNKALDSSINRYKTNESIDSNRATKSLENIYKNSTTINSSSESPSSSQIRMSQSYEDIKYSLLGTGPGIPPSLPPFLPREFNVNAFKLTKRTVAREKKEHASEQNNKENDESLTNKDNRQDVQEYNKSNNNESDTESLFGGQAPNSQESRPRHEAIAREYYNSKWGPSSQESLTFINSYHSNEDKIASPHNNFEDLSFSSDDSDNDLVIDTEGTEESLPDLNPKHHETSTKKLEIIYENEEGRKETTSSTQEETTLDKDVKEQGKIHENNGKKNNTQHEVASDEEGEEDEEVKLVLTSITPTINELEISKAVALKITEKLSAKSKQENTKDATSEAKDKFVKKPTADGTRRKTRQNTK